MVRTLRCVPALAALLAVGCPGSHVGPVGVPPNLVEKSLFEGEHWYVREIVAVEGTPPASGPAPSVTAPFVGALAAAPGPGDAPRLARVTWEITEDFLYAVSVVDDAPVAVFGIAMHVEPDAPDLPWHERSQMRVDWSQNLVATEGLFPGSLEADDGFVAYRRESIPAFFTDLDSRPVFSPERIAVTTSELWTPDGCTGCEGLQVRWRDSFVRVRAGYPPAPLHADEQEAFGGLFVAVDEERSLRGRWNLWEDAISSQPCEGDLDCDPGAHCVGVPARCSTPVERRTPRRVSFVLAPDTPRHLVRGSFLAVAEWNEALMAAHRIARGDALPRVRRRVDCQSESPTAWCFCDRDARAPEVAGDDTCVARTDWLTPTIARLEADPYDCAIEGPPDTARPTSDDDYGAEVFSHRFVGEECALTLEVREPEPLDPVIRWVPDASFCALAQPRLDPTTGEIVTAAVHVGGGCLEQLVDAASELWAIAKGERGEGETFGAPALDGYYDRAHRQAASFTPAPPPMGLRDPAGPRTPVDPAHPEERLRPLAPAAGGEVEARWMAPIEAALWAGLERDDPLAAARVDDPLDAISPLRGAPFPRAIRRRTRDLLLAHHGVSFPRPAHFAMRFHRYWAGAFTGRSDAERRTRWRQANHRAQLTRALGHALGMTTNLAGSVAAHGYPEAWFGVGLETRPPAVADYDDDASGELEPLEAAAWLAELEARRNRALARGLGNLSSSSVMDVHGDLSDLAGVGPGDRASILFHYADRVAILDAVDPWQRIEDERWLRVDLHPTRHFVRYGGGEACAVDEDCPFGPGSAGLPGRQALHQRCVDGPRVEAGPCDGGACVCSTLEADLRAYQEGRGPEAYYRDGMEPHLHALTLEHGGPGAAATDARCQPNDAGASFLEIARDRRALWRDLYPYAFGRAAVPDPTPEMMLAAATQVRDFGVRLFTPGHPFPDAGRLRLANSRLGAIASLTWLGELATLPDATDALPSGLGFSRAAEDGISRGVEGARLMALSALTAAPVEPHALSDGSLIETTAAALLSAEARELLAGIVTDRPRASGPFLGADREGEPALLQPWRSNTRCIPGPCASGLELAGPVPSATLTTRRFALGLALARDTSFALALPLEEADVWPDDACALGEPQPGTTHPICDADQAAYAVYRRGDEAWIASADRSVVAAPPEVGFALLAHLLELRARFEAGEAELEDRLGEGEALLRDLAALQRAVGAARWRVSGR